MNDHDDQDSSRNCGWGYPFARFGVLSESPFSAPELIYAHSERGFALISQRTEEIQRLYFQCPVDEDVEEWSNQEIWDELQARVDGDDGFELKQGPIFERTLLRFRSFVAEPMRWGRLVLAGDAAHTVPPTGAKGLNLAINDVRILHECLVEALGKGGSLDALDAYSPRALDRIWKSENFSYWMTQMLHTPGPTPAGQTNHSPNHSHHSLTAAWAATLDLVVVRARTVSVPGSNPRAERLAIRRTTHLPIAWAALDKRRAQFRRAGLGASRFLSTGNGTPTWPKSAQFVLASIVSFPDQSHSQRHKSNEG